MERPTKVLFDETCSPYLAATLHDLLAPEGFVIDSLQGVGWRSAANGDLHRMAEASGYDMLVTFDVAMASETRPRLPVLVFDALSITHPNFSATAVDVLLAREREGIRDYHAVMVPGVEPSANLRKLALGRYEMNPRLHHKADEMPKNLGRGFLQTQGDDRPARPPLTDREESQLRDAWRGRGGRQQTEVEPRSKMTRIPRLAKRDRGGFGHG